MKSLKLVYRNHLLPAIITPFETFASYHKAMNKKQYEDLRNLRKQFKIKQIDKKRDQMIKQNELILTQIDKFKNSYILPLKESPFYYDELDQIIKNKASKIKYQNQSYEEISKSLNFKYKLMIQKNLKAKYSQFKSKLLQENPHVLNQCIFLPTFIYSSAEDVCIQQKKEWYALSSQQKNDCELKYVSLLENYSLELKKIAIMQNMSISELTEAILGQFQSPLSDGLKRKIFM